MGSKSSKSKRMFVDRPVLNKRFHEAYDIFEEIGLGTFASVHRCARKSDSTQLAAKTIHKKYLNDKELMGLMHEITILKQISHPNIVSLTDVFDDGNDVCLVLELCDGKDLFDAIVETRSTGGLSEARSAQIIFELCNALQYLHSNGVIHRDLKPENILLTVNGTVKLSDFGLAHSALSSSDSFECIVTNTCCGTPHYVAPEILKHQFYNYKVDLWSLGVILYLMLVAIQPFKAKTLSEIYRLIVKGRYDFESKRWNYISHEAKDLIRCLLRVDPKKRYNSQDIKCHPWIILSNQT
eukprot:167619_1